MTTVRLNDDIENKITILTSIHHATKTEIIRRAILEYYENHAPELSPYELGKDLFGKLGSDDGKLSAEYKSRLQEKLREKYSH